MYTAQRRRGVQEEANEKPRPGKRGKRPMQGGVIPGVLPKVSNAGGKPVGEAFQKGRATGHW